MSPSSIPENLDLEICYFQISFQEILMHTGHASKSSSKWFAKFSYTGQNSNVLIKIYDHL